MKTLQIVFLHVSIGTVLSTQALNISLLHNLCYKVKILLHTDPYLLVIITKDLFYLSVCWGRYVQLVHLPAESRKRMYPGAVGHLIGVLGPELGSSSDPSLQPLVFIIFIWFCLLRYNSE